MCKRISTKHKLRINFATFSFHYFIHRSEFKKLISSRDCLSRSNLRWLCCSIHRLRRWVNSKYRRPTPLHLLLVYRLGWETFVQPITTHHLICSSSNIIIHIALQICGMIAFAARHHIYMEQNRYHYRRKHSIRSRLVNLISWKFHAYDDRWSLYRVGIIFRWVHLSSITA